MSIQDIAHQGTAWVISTLGGAAITGVAYSYQLFMMVSDSAWEELSRKTPELVVMVILCAIFLRYLGGKIDKLTEAINELVTGVAVMQATAKTNCKFRHEVGDTEDSNEK